MLVTPDAAVIEVDFTKYMRREYFARHEVLIDTALGRLGARRRYAGRTYRPAAEVLARPGGPVFVHEGHFGTTAPELIRHLGETARSFSICMLDLLMSYSRKELRRLVRCATKVICVSSWLRDHVRERLGPTALQDRCVVVPNGVDLARFTPVGRVVRERPTVLFVGSVTAQKGPDVLLAAARLLAARDLDFRVLIVGSSTHAVGLELSPYEIELRLAAAELGDRVEFRPFEPNEQMPDIYRSADILVVPSQFDEPFGLVVLEGMASGLAVVATLARRPARRWWRRHSVLRFGRWTEHRARWSDR